MFDKKIEENCQRLILVNEKAQKWIKDNPKLIPSPDRILSDFRKGARNLKKVQKALKKPMCTGVFGPSQAGKSYLLSTLAKGVDGKLIADFGEKTLDFLESINPDGGKESTGLVTRFTLHAQTSPISGFPVHLNLLSEMDLVKIIANTYYSDCQNKAIPAREEIKKRLDSLETYKGPANNTVSLDDIEELREYIEGEFDSQMRVNDLRRDFWPAAADLAPFLPLEKRVKLYSLIWDEVGPLTDLLRVLLSNLEKLGFAEEAYAPISSLVPKTIGIIDVAQLFDCGENSAEKKDLKPPIELRTTTGKVAVIPRWIVTAITAELTIKMQSSPGDLFQHTDLLDFPGYRSRFKYQNIKQELSVDGDEKSRQMFLRGKVAYLFQKYSRDKELTSMLLCVGPGNQEVKDLPIAIDKWVCETHGSDENERKQNTEKDSLLLVLTKADLDFEDKAGLQAGDVARWKNRISASLTDYFANGFSWPRKWRGNEPFKNVFLLRNPNVQWHAVMEFENNKDGIEVGIRRDRRDYVEKLRQSFLSCDSVLMHFDDPNASWDALMKLNDGGISYLKEHLSPLCEKSIKERQLKKTLTEEAKRALTNLEGFYHTDDKEEERKKKDKFIAEIYKLYKNKSSGVFKAHLWELLHCFRVTPEELENLAAQASRRLKNFENSEKEEQKEDQESSEEVDISSIFGNPEALFGSEEEETETVKECQKDFNTFYAETVIEYWLDKLYSIAKNPKKQRYFGIREEIFLQLISEFETALRREDVQGKVETKFREISEPANVSVEKKQRKQAAFASSYLNNFVCWLGNDPSNGGIHKKIDAMEMDIFVPEPEVEIIPKLPPSSELMKKNVKHFYEWSFALYDLMRKNIYFDGKSEFDVQQNAILGEILKDVRSM